MGMNRNVGRIKVHKYEIYLCIIYHDKSLEVYIDLIISTLHR